MLNVSDLERQWLRYKIKKALPFSIVVTVSILLVISFFMLDNSEESKEIAKNTPVKEIVQVTPNQNSKPIAQTPAVVVEKQVIMQQEPQKPIALKHNDVLTLEPSMQFINKFEDNTLSNDVDPQLYTPTEQTPHTNVINQNQPSPQTNNLVDTKPIRSEVVTQTTPIESINEPKVSEPVIETQKSHMTISQQTTSSEIQDVIKRFKKNKNPALSLFIAKYYYDNKQYDQSYNYALMTNEIDSNIEESWLVFAKSLVKLDQKDMAITTLNSYIEYSASSNAKQLLQDINQGKFK